MLSKETLKITSNISRGQWEFGKNRRHILMVYFAFSGLVPRICKPRMCLKCFQEVKLLKFDISIFKIST